MKENLEQPISEPDEAALKPVRKPRKATRRVQEFLGGDYLSKEWVVGNLPFLLFVSVLAMFYIGNTYYTEKTYKDIERTKNELKELRYQYINTLSELMFQSRQTEIVKKAETYGLKESILPPYKILYGGGKKEKEE